MTNISLPPNLKTFQRRIKLNKNTIEVINETYNYDIDDK